MRDFYSIVDDVSTSITKQALKTINHFRRGRADLSQLQTAFKALAGAGNLYKNPDTGYEHRFKDYYWLNNDHLENIDGDYREIEKIERYQIISYGNIYVKVKPSECDSMDYSEMQK